MDINHNLPDPEMSDFDIRLMTDMLINRGGNEKHIRNINQMTSKVESVVWVTVKSLLHLRCGVSVWHGDHHPVYRPDAEEEDCRPSSPDRSIVGVYKVNSGLSFPFLLLY